MISLEDLELEKLRITGEVSVRLYQQGVTTNLSQSPFKVLLMGPTGAGKSSFIEALAGPRHALGKISSGRLEGCTQSVIQYQLTGVEILYSGESWVSLIDTPGFADPKVSEFDIVSLIRKWWGDNEEQYFDQIIYVTPVNSVRLPGSQRALLKTFMKLMGEGGAGMLTIVTTMWDGVWGPQASKRAERNFEQLEKEVWKDFIANGSKIAKFFNTQKSALQILDQVCQMPSKFTNLEYFSRPIHNLPYTDELRDDLRSRVHSLQMQKDILETELVSGVKNKRLKDILEAQLEETARLITKFHSQLKDIPLMSEAETNSLADHIPLASPPSSRPSSTPLDDVTEVDSASRDHPLALAASSGSLSPIAHPANIQAESSSLHPFTPLTRGATASSSPTYSISTPLSSDKLTPSSGTSLPSATASPPGRQPSGRPARAVGAIKQRVKRLLGRDGH